MSTLYPQFPNTTFPNSVQTFVTLLNMAVADAPYIKEYQEAMQNGDTATAQQAYNQITNANQKFIDADKINQLIDTCGALQQFYQTDIVPYISTKEAQWSNSVAQFAYKGTYSSSTQYYVNNFVTYNVNGVDQVFICTAAPPIGTLPSMTAYWRQLSVRGLQGVSGTGVSFRYTWSSSEAYYLNDVVTYDNTVWSCIQPNTNQAPSFSSNYWKAIYTAAQVVYPFQSAQPTGMTTGWLWFQTT